MAISNKIPWYSLSNGAIIKELADNLKKERIEKNMTQSELAERTGLDRSTISQIENGRIASVLSFIQILRALEKLDLLNAFQVKKQVSPIEMLKVEQGRHIRARSAGNNNKERSAW